MTDSNPRFFRLLLVDDDRDILEFFQQILGFEKSNLSIHSESEISAVKNDFRTTPNLVLQPFDVVTCQQGDEAVDVVKNAVKEGRPFSVAFIDIRMPPGPDGIWTSEHIRTLDPNIEIVIMTGYSDADPFSIASRVPPMHKLLYLKKPLDMKEIHQFAYALSMKWYTECELQKVHRELEQRVEDRTRKLREINEKLKTEVTEHQQTQLSLQESEGKLNAMLSSITDHISMMDKDLNIVWANNITKNIFGERIIGKKCYEVYHRREEPCEPNFCPTIKAFEDGQAHSDEIQIIDKDGNVRFFYRTANVALRDEDKDPLTVIQVSRDITEQKQSQQSLQKSEEKYRAIAENSRVGFWQTTLDGHTIYINPAMCEMLEVDGPEAVQEKTYHSFYSAENQKIIKRELAKRKKGISSTYEVEILGQKGGRRNLMVSGAPIFLSEDKIHSAIATFVDITEKKRAEKALMKSHKELEQRVEERTFELSGMLEAIKLSEEELIQHKSELEKVNKELFETNRALSVLARNIDREKELLENKIHDSIVTDIMPVIMEFQNNKKCRQCAADLELLRVHLNGLISGPSEYRNIVILLTEQEMRVAALIKKGMTNNQIGKMLFISEHTVKTHRRNIRKKLKIQNANINLGSYLKSKFK